MILAQDLVDHARRLARWSRAGDTSDIDLRRGVSAAYYAVFHDLTELAVDHLIGSAGGDARAAIRRTWTHAELKAASELVVDRAKVIDKNPAAPVPKALLEFGPLPDLAAADADLVVALRQFCDLQEVQHAADYDHQARFDDLGLLAACQKAEAARSSIRSASPTAREAFLTLLTVRRSDFRERI